MAGERSAALRALGALAGEGAVVAGIAACPDHRRMVHRIGNEARCRIVVAIAALDDTGRDMRRRRQPGRRRAVVTIRAVGVGCLVDIGAARPTREAARLRWRGM